MEAHDDDLRHFEAHGAPALPEAEEQGYVERDGARIWYSAYGAGPAVILLHGGLGHSGNWGHQVPSLVETGRRSYSSIAAVMAAVRAIHAPIVMS